MIRESIASILPRPAAAASSLVMDIYYLCKTRYWLVTSGSVTTAGLQQRSRVIKLSADPGAELVAGSWCRWAGQVAACCCTMLPPVMNTSASTIQQPGPELSPHLLTTDHSHVHISHQPSPAQPSQPSPAMQCAMREQGRHESILFVSRAFNCHCADVMLT